MAQQTARMLVWFALAGLGLVPVAPARSEPPATAPERVAYLVGQVTPDELLLLTTATAADESKVVVVDSPAATPYTHDFLRRFQPDRVVAVGAFPAGVPDLERRLGVCATEVIRCRDRHPMELWTSLVRRPPRAVVCPAEPRRLLLQAACLAGVERLPLLILTGTDGETTLLRRQLRDGGTKRVIGVGAAAMACRRLPDVAVEPLADEAAVTTAYRQAIRKRGPVRALVVTNPDDAANGGMSTLAPFVAMRRRAPLLFTNAAGDNVEGVVGDAVADPRLQAADALLLVANLEAIPMHRRPNPIAADKDKEIPLEPLTPTGDEPFSFATGRLFHHDPGVVLLMFARQYLLRQEERPLGRGERKLLLAADSGENLPLLETLSRNTLKELRNGGYQATALFGRQIKADVLRRLLPEQDVFLWEGHHNTLFHDFEFADWDEPLRPSLMFVQTCLGLREGKMLPLLKRGAVATVASPVRNYSGSGGACSMAFFDALMYDRQTVGGALRHAKNFLLAYAQLKEKRLGDNASRTGANLRSAWSFTLWGDPTWTPPLPPKPADALPPVRHRVVDDTIELRVPRQAYDRTYSAKYQVQTLPNVRLAGLIRRPDPDEEAPLVPLLFAEVPLPHIPDGAVPHLNSRLPANRWVFLWDGRRRCGYLLVAPRDLDRGVLRFTVELQSPSES